MGINTSTQFGSGRQATKGIFRRLATNKFIHGLNWATKHFGFRTVFHQSSYSYCCCACAYEHEFVSYISIGGEINEEIYGRILESILTGSCPHVTEVPSEYTKDTGIQALHIAAAANTVLKLKYVYNSTGSDLRSMIFQLDPENVAICHESLNFVKECKNYFKSKLRDQNFTHKVHKMLHATRLSGVEYKVLFEYITQSEFCIRIKNRELLHLVLDPFWTQSDLNQTLQLCLADSGLSDMRDDILKYLCNDVYHLEDYAISAIAYDDDRALKYILDLIKSRRQWNVLEMTLPNICEVLGKNRLKRLLAEYGFYEQNITDDKRSNLTMLHYLREHHAWNYFQHIKAAFDALSTNQKASVNIGYKSIYDLNPLFRAIERVDPREVETLLKLGADVDAKHMNRKTPISHLLTLVGSVSPLNAKNFLEVLVMLIAENPDIQLNKRIVEDAITVDEFFMKPASWKKLEIAGTFVLDGKEHSVHSTEDSYVLNFIAPLLIECGFVYSRKVLLNALDRRLHSKELDYFRHYLDNPRSLMLSSRDVLRKHFKNRLIHKFVRRLAFQIPKTIQDVILVQDILTTSQRYLA